MSDSETEYESVIGLEVHVQLATKSKIFCGSSTQFAADPNQHIDPLTLGLPGSLPVLNRSVVDCAILIGLATNCEIRSFNRFARKHYFYPDLPKGYQISQFDEPICERGSIEVHFQDPRLTESKDGAATPRAATRSIGIKRIHMEEDAGKNIHDGHSHCSLIDLNRAGVPLLEVVSEPDLRSPAEAGAYLRAIRQLVRFLGISDGNMEEGSLRCDANVSLRPVGDLKFGTRTEIKNLNSFRFVERAIEYEIARQLAVIRSGQQVTQQTMQFDSDTGATRAMRSKEESADYRYFPDPDLPPLVIQESWIAEMRAKMPKLPAQTQKELIENYGLSSYDASVLTDDRLTVEYFYKVLEGCGNARLACNWLTTELFGLLNKNGVELVNSPVSAESLGKLLNLLEKEEINGKMAKAVFEEMFATSKDPLTIVSQKGLKQITSDDQIRTIILQVFEKFPGQLAEFVAGNEKLHGFFVGETMKASSGAANPKKVNDIIRAEVSARRG